jgi:hypothetical protein
VIECSLTQGGVMSRTHRNTSFNKCALRNPRTTQEIRQNRGLIQDISVGEYDYSISGVNRLHRNIVTAWDDVVTSSHYQEDYKLK